VLARIALLYCAFPAIFAAGCGDDLVSAITGRSRSSLALDMVGLDASPTYQESDSNDLFELAEPVQLREEREIIGGSISVPVDVDVFDLGPVSEGDRVVVTMSAAETLNGAIAVFDQEGSTLLVNDHRNLYLGIQIPFVDVVFRRPSGRCFVAVTATPGYTSHGEYVLGAFIEPDADIPPHRPDTVLLDFEGATNVRIGSRPEIDVPSFNAADIDLRYEGWSQAMAAEIIRRVRQDFAGLNITILSTTEGHRDGDSASRIYFGAVDNALLGVAEGVDEYNAARNQRAIVFIESFAAFMRLNPTPEEMAQAIANVASHEIGHLLGLVHTEDPADIMDVTASLNQLLRDQAFGRSPIYRIVFPIGYQDSAQLLLDSVGGDADLFSSFAKQRELVRARAKFDPPAPPARASGILGSCGCAPPMASGPRLD
jgi:hypothetical protein